MHAGIVLSYIQFSVTPWTIASHGIFCLRDFPGMNTEWVAISFSRDLLTQGSNLRLLHRQVDSLPLNCLGNPLSLLLF